jgi:protein O-GlcNAc transferase
MEQDKAAALQSRFRQGLVLHRQGDLAAAERIYHEVLEQEPRHFDAQHMQAAYTKMLARQRAGLAPDFIYISDT